MRIAPSIIVLLLLLLVSNPQPINAQNEQHFIADFESDKFLEGKKTSHKSSVTLVNDVPKGGGKFAVKTAIESDAGTKHFFGTGFKIPVTEFTKSGEIRFWIKADFESGFNFQCSSGAGKTSVFPFTTVGCSGKWTLISAPVDKFSKPPWAKEKADLNAVHFFQITAFGSGPYDGKTFILDNVVAAPLSKNESNSPSKPASSLAATLRARAALENDESKPKSISLSKSMADTGWSEQTASRFSLTASRM